MLKQLSAAECLRQVDLVIEAYKKFLLASERSEAKNCSGRRGGDVKYLEGREVEVAGMAETKGKFASYV